MSILRLVSAVLVLIALSGCHNEPQTQYKERFDRFLTVLESAEKGLLEAYRFDEAARLFSARLASGKVDRQDYSDILAEENIEIFNPEQVFAFFGGSVFSRFLYYRFISFADREELDLFNKRLLPATARALASRFSSNPGVSERFRKLFPARTRLSPGDRIIRFLRHSPDGIKAAPAFFRMDRDAINRFIGIRPDIKETVDAASAAMAGKWGLLWDSTRAGAVADGLPREIRDRLLRDYGRSGASLDRYRILSLVLFFRDVVDEKIDFYSPASWYRLRLLL